MKVTKAELAGEVVELLMEQGHIEHRPVSEYSDLILDIQDIFSNHWDEQELEEEL